MKIKVNRNILWTETFINELVNQGVKYACISPGSRNTPLTFAIARQSSISTYAIIDERSSGFFALGLARASRSPVVLVCTSGTATAEFYPAVVEAYQQRIPLIVLTADRPPELIGCGANQTINQDNIYSNHINWFVNAGLPETDAVSLKNIRELARVAFEESSALNPGPVHINFPFRKPFEPDDYTDEIEQEIFDLRLEDSGSGRNRDGKDRSKYLPVNEIDQLYNFLKDRKKGLIIVGPGNFDKDFALECHRLSEMLKFPVLADGASQLRFGSHPKTNIISCFEGFIRPKEFLEKVQPDIILHFGRTATSRGIEAFLEKSEATRFIINDYGDWFDPTNKAIASIAVNPSEFCSTVTERLSSENYLNDDPSWLNLFLDMEYESVRLKRGMIDNETFPFEGRIINEVINLMPQDSALMISNSMPVRDLDYFAPKTENRIEVYNNRGASGIDGITSTALGISAGLKNKPTVLVTGDLAFYYDMNGLLASRRFNIPLVIVLINNNGGGIFNMLPVSSYKEVFNEYFVTPHNLDFSIFVKGYGGCFKNVSSWNDFRTSFSEALSSGSLHVIQINTDSAKSTEIRKKFWHQAGSIARKILG